MKNKAVQIFTDEYLKNTRNLTKEEIVIFQRQFVELLSGVDTRRKLISIRVPENLLHAFKICSKIENRPYQTKLIELMREFVKST